MNEMSDRSGIQTHASEDIAALTQRLGPLDHTACKIKYRPTFAFAQGQHPLSRVSLELFALCNLLFHGFSLWKKTISRLLWKLYASHVTIRCRLRLLKNLVGHQGVDAAFFAFFILLLSGRPSVSKTTSFQLLRVSWWGHSYMEICGGIFSLSTAFSWSIFGDQRKQWQEWDCNPRVRRYCDLKAAP